MVANVKYFSVLCKMNIKAEYSYTVKEAHLLTGIHKRKLNRVAVENNIPKLDNRYIFTGAFLIERFKLKEVAKMSEGVIPLRNNTNTLEEKVKSLEESVLAHRKTLESHQKLIGLLSQRINNLLEEYS